jgi:hypothetical protein
MPDPVLTPDRYPHLADEGYQPESPQTPFYNCIAWVVNDIGRWWWPHPNSYWPPGCRLENSVEAFVEMFAHLGFAECANGDVEAGFEKIALYAKFDLPTHAARQEPDGKWTSKIGQYIDMKHTLVGLEGPEYGRVAKFFRKSIPQP